MTLTVARTPDGIDILLTGEHHVCMSYKLPVVAIGNDVATAEVKGKLDRIETDKGLLDAARLVVDWLESGPERSVTERAMAFRFLKDAPECL